TQAEQTAHTSASTQKQPWPWPWHSSSLPRRRQRLSPEPPGARGQRATSSPGSLGNQRSGSSTTPATSTSERAATRRSSTGSSRPSRSRRRSPSCCGSTEGPGARPSPTARPRSWARSWSGATARTSPATPTRGTKSREPAVPGGAGGRGVLLHQQDGGPGPPRRPRDGAGLVHLPPQLARQVPGVQGPRLLHRRRELRRALRPAARRSHLRGEQSGGQRQHHQPQRLHDWQRGAERRDGPAGHGGVRVEPRHHLRRAALGGDAGVRLLQGGGRRRQAREGLLVGRPRLHGRLRRHRHLQHLHADVPLPLRRLRLRRAALVQARHRAPPLLPARTTSYSLSLSDISGSAYTVCEKENKCLVVAVVRTQEAWHMMRRAPAGYDPCTEAYVTRYFNRQDVQRALHANRTGLKYPYSPCRLVLVP
uniref:Uncharacterized protein n=1 Tax=Aegilops tauschii subsp. strangulata TaxID=200361 RepID=A0A453CGY2_AEGTS